MAISGTTAGLLGAGIVLRAVGSMQADAAQAAAEQQNSAWYREQAAYAKATGERQQAIFDRETSVLYGEQTSAFAKAGVDTSNSSSFMAATVYARASERTAIGAETDMNVRLAELRARQTDMEAETLNNKFSQYTNIAANLTGVAGSLI